jgi:DNA-directed RNA polymerase sigma subunit (sigma70/sigma32)
MTFCRREGPLSKDWWGYEEWGHWFEQASGEEIEDILASLSPKVRRVIKFRFGLCGKSKLSVAETAKKVKATEERVRQFVDLGFSGMSKFMQGTED